MEPEQAASRRKFIRNLALGAAVVTLGGITYYVGTRGENNRARQILRPDGKPSLPPGQRVLVEGPRAEGTPSPCSGGREHANRTGEPAETAAKTPDAISVDATHKENRLPPGQHEIAALKPMGGVPGDPSRANFKLKVYGEVEHELELNFDQLLEFQVYDQKCDVHCVTTWSLLGSVWTGVRISDLAKKAGLKKGARHVIFEAAAGYTANVPLDEALKDNAMVTWAVNGEALGRPHGPPCRSLIPDRYFWKSAKWLTGIRFQEKDEPGYWETRGYSNSADPWKEERYW